MSPTLEERRRAIVEALRAIMTEPLEADPANAESRSLLVVLSTEPEPYPDHEQPQDRYDDPRHDLDPSGPVAPPVPPVKRLGAMSRAASRALFGHD